MVLGLVHKHWEDFITLNYGAETWKKIASAAGLSERISFISSCPYSDDIIFRLFECAGLILGQDVHEINRAFGEFFIKAVGKQGYGKLLQSLGPNLLEALNNLNNLHLHLSMGMPAFVAPELRVEKVTPKSMELHYVSTRPSLGWWLEGHLQALANEYFNLRIEIELLRGRADGSCDHEVYALRYPHQDYEDKRQALQQQAQLAQYAMPAHLFFQLFPFAFIMDEGCTLVQVGFTLQRMFPAMQPGRHVREFFRIRHPYAAWDATKIKELHQSCFLLTTPTGLELKGQFVETAMPDGTTVLLFMGSPRISDLDEMQRHGLYFSDYPLHDLGSDFVLLAEQRKVEADLKEQFEQQNVKLEHNNMDLEEEKTRLKESLVEALAARDKKVEIDMDSPADKALHVLDKILQGEQVNMQEVMAARDAIMEAGQDLRQPVNFRQQMSHSNMDNAVNESLIDLLSTRRPPQIIEEDEDAYAEDTEFENVEDGAEGEDFKSCPMLQAEDLAGMMFVGSLDGNEEESAHTACTCPYAAQPQQGRHSLDHAHTRNPPNGHAVHEGVSGSQCTAQQQQQQQPAGVRPAPQHANHTTDSPVKCPLPLHSGSRTSLPGTSPPAAPHSPRVSHACPASPRHSNATPSRNYSVASSLGEAFSSAINALPEFGRPDHSRGPSRGCSLRALGPAAHLQISLETISAFKDMLAANGTDDMPGGAPEGGTKGGDGFGSAFGSVIASASASAVPSARPSLELVRAGEHFCGGPEPQKVPGEGRRLTTTESLGRRGGTLNRLLSKGRIAWEGAAAPGAAAAARSSPQLENLYKEPHDHIAAVLAKVDEWQYDSFELDAVTNGRPLSLLTFALLKRSGVLDRLPFDERRLARFLLKLEDGYDTDNPYHNRIHAADVVRTLHVISTRGGVLRSAHCLGDPGVVLGTYLAAAIHDYQHKGVNNAFLVRVSDPLALLYNDASPMENHHVAATFMLMNEPQYNFLEKMSTKVKETVRKVVIALVLATDMKQHFGQLSLFNTKLGVRDRRNGKAHSRSTSGTTTPLSHSSMSLSQHVPGTGFGMHAAPGSSMAASMDDDSKILVLQMALKCADLGHLTSAASTHRHWVQLLEEEMYRQGDREKALSLPVSALMDRSQAGVTKSQTGFFNIVVMPLFTAFSQVFPRTLPLLNTVRENYNMWKLEEMNAAAAPSTGGLAKP
eukprot:CAMPEP_0202897216 /NCGR_PEP_ID=MMETSP1392-20130828/6039_1 /ASSEMBLY_ACC=CAM_ASM_000868 /TAXON_ID=225041 /ORGANISM="Chlamydomonas chlamydogama, Strain SAG 11-48b" /LENGTH=1191 /DNA_ID=CAMNT_0049582803 /DNA_START=21 /DNA_END=3596 /DNA_ORIENTATION=-